MVHVNFISTRQRLKLPSQKMKTSESARISSGFIDTAAEGIATSVWESFQCELVIAKIIYGHPLYHISRIYANNLGPEVDYSLAVRLIAMDF